MTGGSSRCKGEEFSLLMMYAVTEISRKYFAYGLKKEGIVFNILSMIGLSFR